MIKYKLFWIFILTAVFNNCWAQQSFFNFGSRDSTYIKDFERQYSLQFSTWYNKFTFFIDPTVIKSNPKSLKLSPNLRPQWGISMGLKYLSLSFGIATPFHINSNKKYGETKFLDFTAGYFRGFFGLESYISIYDGLYQNTDKGGIKVRTNAGMFAGGFNAYYAFNYRKFSFSSAIKNQELQYKNAGSIVLMASIGLKSINADTALIQGNFKSPDSVAAFNNLFELRNKHFSIRPGYAYNFSFKKGRYFVSPAAFVGAGISKILVSKGHDNYSSNSIDFDLHSKVAFGYNHHTYYWNIYTMYDITFNQISENTSTSFNNFYLGFNFGYRFKHFIKKVKWL